MCYITLMCITLGEIQASKSKQTLIPVLLSVIIIITKNKNNNKIKLWRAHNILIIITFICRGIGHGDGVGRRGFAFPADGGRFLRLVARRRLLRL